MTLAAEQVLNGVVTRRGIGVTRTVHGQVVAHASGSFSGIGAETVEVPVPPVRRLGASKGILFKYFNEGDPSGDFNFIERQTSNVTAVARGYLVNGRNGPETLKQKRLKQQFLSITSLIRVYVGRGIQVEVGCWLEYE